MSRGATIVRSAREEGGLRVVGSAGLCRAGRREGGIETTAHPAWMLDYVTSGWARWRDSARDTVRRGWARPAACAPPVTAGAETANVSEGKSVSRHGCRSALSASRAANELE